MLVGGYMEEKKVTVLVCCLMAALFLFLVVGLALPPKKGFGIVVKDPEVTRFCLRGVVKTPEGKIETVNFEGGSRLFEEGDKIPLKKHILSPEWEIDE